MIPDADLQRRHALHLQSSVATIVATAAESRESLLAGAAIDGDAERGEDGQGDDDGDAY